MGGFKWLRLCVLEGALGFFEHDPSWSMQLFAGKD
jgi:hypothetical protein